MSERHESCTNCQCDRSLPGGEHSVGTGLSRRSFLLAAGAAASTLVLPSWGRGAEAAMPVSETKIKDLFDSLSSDQRKTLCFSFDDPLRKKVQANWEITKPKIEDLTEAQQDLVESIFNGLISEEGRPKFEKQMQDDAGGMSQYHIALFGEPGGKFEFVMTGRHMTVRADGNSVDKVAFGGPMVYGHAAVSFNEPADHKDNVFWYQGVRANEVFQSLNADQQGKALVKQSPKEDSIAHRTSGFDGIGVGELMPDQKKLVEKVMSDLLSPYRKEDADEVMAILTKNGGLDRTHLAFYQMDEQNKNADIGKDKVWDIWRLEGPGFVWHFRGAPHVHTWVNIAEV